MITWLAADAPALLVAIIGGGLGAWGTIRAARTATEVRTERDRIDELRAEALAREQMELELRREAKADVSAHVSFMRDEIRQLREELVAEREGRAADEREAELRVAALRRELAALRGRMAVLESPDPAEWDAEGA